MIKNLNEVSDSRIPYYYAGLITNLFFVIDPVEDDSHENADVDGDGLPDQRLHESEFEAPQSKGISILSPKGLIHFTLGFIEGTHLVYNTTNLQQCGYYAEYSYAHQVANIMNMHWTHDTAKNIFNVLYHVYGMLYTLDAAVESCEHTMVDAWDHLMLAFDDGDDFMKAFSNTFHNLTLMYEAVMRAIVFFRNEYYGYSSPYQTG